MTIQCTVKSLKDARYKVVVYPVGQFKCADGYHFERSGKHLSPRDCDPIVVAELRPIADKVRLEGQKTIMPMGYSLVVEYTL